MSEVAPSELKTAVESQHGGAATFVQAVPVHEQHNGETVWDGVVHVFDLAGHPSAKRAYAWSYERPDGKRRFFAVLHVPPIIGPREAVQAAIVAENKCLACEGTGYIYETRSAEFAHSKPPTKTCLDCGGTGVKRL